MIAASGGSLYPDALAPAREWLDRVTSCTGDAAAVINVETLEVVLANPQFATQVAGRALEDVIGFPPPVHVDEVARERLARIARGDMHEYETVRRVVRDDGSQLRTVIRLRALAEAQSDVKLVGLRTYPLPASCAAQTVIQLAPLLDDLRYFVAVCARDGTVLAVGGALREAVIGAGNVLAMFANGDRDEIASVMVDGSVFFSARDARLLDGSPACVYVGGAEHESDVVIVRAMPPGQEDANVAPRDEKLMAAAAALEQIGALVWSTGLVELPGAFAQPPNIEQLAQLTDKERRVVFAILRGQQVATIAKSMFVSPSTIRNYLSGIYAKLGVANKSELIEVLHGTS